MNCKFCESLCQKAGRQKNGTQKHYCKQCKKFQQAKYVYNAYEKTVDKMICELVCESVSIRGIGRVLKIGTGTVLRRIQQAGKKIVKPAILLNQPELQVDELRTFIGRKGNEYWLAYALNKETGGVVDFVIGKRSKRTLKMLINTLLLSGVHRIRTDCLGIYRSLIPSNRHLAGAYCINHIERKNLSVRTHLKRLSRRTICFSRSLSVLCNVYELSAINRSDIRTAVMLQIINAKATEEGDHKVVNEKYHIIVNAAAFLKEKGELLRLKEFLKHPAIGPRMWAATYLLSIEKNATEVLKSIIDEGGILALTAETTLSEWKKGNLKL